MIGACKKRASIKKRKHAAMGRAPSLAQEKQVMARVGLGMGRKTGGKENK